MNKLLWNTYKKRLELCLKKTIFQFNSIQALTLNTIRFISQIFVIFWVTYWFPTDKFYAELPLWNVINKSLRCVQYVLLKNFLLYPMSQLGINFSRQPQSMPAPTLNTIILISWTIVCFFFNTILVFNQWILRRVTVAKRDSLLSRLCGICTIQKCSAINPMSQLLWNA